MKIAKVNPVLIDAVIDYIQNVLESELGFQNWENNHRAYKTPIANERFFKAEVYNGNGEYRECFFNDYFYASSFFIANDLSEFRNGKMQQKASFIFQCKLKSLFPEIDHRADEELRNKLFQVFSNLDDSIVFEGFETGIENVYNEFDRTNLKYHDFGDFHVIRVNFKARFNGTCCNEC
ncbi:MAG: hypothetical protein FGM14_14080 [Flavobacteriales bacterium]|nr:hypothetical protein [Flavobacteriales bacterium]